MALEERSPLALGAHCQQGTDVGIHLFRLAMVGMKGDVDRVLAGGDVGEFGESGGPGGHVFDEGARQEFGTAGGNLDDPIRFCLGETRATQP